MGAIGWRAAFLWLGGGILVVALPVVLLLLRDDPDQAAARAGAAAARAESPMAVSEILRHANFWWLALSFFVCGVTTAGLIDTHFIPYAQDHHVSAVTAASAFGVLSLVNMVFTTLSGAVSDRVGYTRLLGWIYAGRAVTLVFLVFARDPVSLFIFAVTFGIVDFSTVAPTTALSTIIFGRRSAGTVYGLVSLSHQVGSPLARTRAASSTTSPAATSDSSSPEPCSRAPPPSWRGRYRKRLPPDERRARLTVRP